VATGTRLARVPDLTGREVVLAGRLASVSRAEAHERVVAAGGRLADAPGPATAWVVVPDDGVPLGDDGALSSPLEAARARIESGQALELIGEAEFRARLGLAEPAERRFYTAAQLARILDVPPQRLAAWVRAGLIQPAVVVKRLARFEFREVARARALARLAARGVSAGRIRASLEALARWWPGASAPLAQLDALEEDGPLVVRTPSGTRAEPGGQLFLDFAPAAGAPQHALPARGAVPESEVWFQRALRLEQAERLEEAVQAYARALDPAHRRPEVAFNLGNALYALERLDDAAAAFGLALELDPEYVEAWNNLGNALSLLGRHAEARARFEHALALEPGYADAHFNLGETLAALGDVEGARRHWRAYLAHDPDSSWAAEGRARLRRTDPRPALGTRDPGERPA
jgi:tetratricopeptide (TPR) repeat protein